MKEPEKLVEGAKVEPSKPVPVAVKVAEKPPVIKTQPKKFEKPKLVEAPQVSAVDILRFSMLKIIF